MTKEEFLRLLIQKNYPEIADFLKTPQGAAYVEERDWLNCTPLYNACQEDDVELAEILLAAGADGYASHEGETPYAVASEKIKAAILRAEERPKKPKIPEQDLQSYAAGYGYFYPAHSSGADEILMKKGKRSDGNTLLHLACDHQNLELVEKLLAVDVDVNKKNQARKTPAQLTKNEEIGDLINAHTKAKQESKVRSSNAVMNKRFADDLYDYPGAVLSEDGLKRMHHLINPKAEQKSAVDATELLSSLCNKPLDFEDVWEVQLKNAKTNILCFYQENPQHPSLTPDLLPRLQQNFSLSDFQRCQERLAVVMVKDLLASGGIDPAKSAVCFYDACQSGNFALARVLFDHLKHLSEDSVLIISSCCKFSNYQSSALATAIEERKEEEKKSSMESLAKIVEKYQAVKRGEGIDGYYVEDEPLFFKVCAEGDYESACELIKMGVDVNVDVRSETPFSVVCDIGHKPLFDLLLTQSVDVYTSDFGGHTPLHMLAYGRDKMEDRLEMVKILVQYIDPSRIKQEIEQGTDVAEELKDFLTSTPSSSVSSVQKKSLKPVLTQPAL